MTHHDDTPPDPNRPDTTGSDGAHTSPGATPVPTGHTTQPPRFSEVDLPTNDGTSPPPLAQPFIAPAPSGQPTSTQPGGPPQAAPAYLAAPNQPGHSQPHGAGGATTGPPNSSSGNTRTWMVVPIIAVVLLGLGFALFVFGRGGDEESDGPTTDPERTEATVADDPPENSVDASVPDVGSTVPVGSDPLVVPPSSLDPTPGTSSPVTLAPDTPTTPTGDLPSLEMIRNALLGLSDLPAPEWTQDPVDLTDICETNDETDNALYFESVSFSRVDDANVSIVAIGNSILSFTDVAAAQRAFDREVSVLGACSGQTVDLDGDIYDVEVVVQQFPEAADTFPCADQTYFNITRLSNDSALVPLISQVTATIRCGANIDVISFGTNAEIDALDNPVFLQSATTSAIRFATLPGSVEAAPPETVAPNTTAATASTTISVEELTAALVAQGIEQVAAECISADLFVTLSPADFDQVALAEVLDELPTDLEATAMQIVTDCLSG